MICVVSEKYIGLQGWILNDMKNECIFFLCVYHRNPIVATVSWLRLKCCLIGKRTTLHSVPRVIHTLNPLTNENRLTLVNRCYNWICFSCDGEGITEGETSSCRITTSHHYWLGSAWLDKSLQKDQSAI